MTILRTNAAEPFFATSRPDARADRGRREIAISDTHVTINRRVGGVDMHLALQVTAYRGVALCLQAGQDGAVVYQVRLVHPDTELTVVLDEALDDRNIIADWRLWARVLNMPALVERSVGHYEVAESTPDSVEADNALPRRHRPSKTRPRFLSRRQMGVPGAPVIYTGEREIIARD
ncbi:DUF6101 family protein [Lichenihabitans sp. Uapishka_5]|uniref:DUF6101 family protein n=1 Tax=Lichenihabitans sp. Uapishka_5 TaxID=3037302 RepID=UPI0029E82925|nr:DUF6101 family protein [Lichenihabitans sp. Uapishka_5]MDX7953688.1 DUF6101 family protein [Lichenihabitans sp. Uapishka_5]